MSADLRIAVIGCGNMGAALAIGLAGLKDRNLRLTGFDPDAEKLKGLAAKIGLNTAASPLAAAKDAEVIFLCVKPKLVAGLAAELAPELAPGQVLVSIAAGIKAADIRAAAGHACPVVRTMPTTTLLVQEGLFAVVFDDPKLNQPWAGADAIRKKAWLYTLKRSGVRYRHLYQTRHTFATANISRGCNLFWLSTQMGHKGPEMLFRHYGSYLAEYDGQTAKAPILIQNPTGK